MLNIEFIFRFFVFRTLFNERLNYLSGRLAFLTSILQMCEGIYLEVPFDGKKSLNM